MQSLRLAALGAAILVVIAGPSFAEDPQYPATPCAFVDQIDNFQYLDEKSAILETSPSKRFKVTFFNTCRELRWAIFARVEARPGICLAKGDKIIVGRDHGAAERCIIDSIEALPPKIQASPAATPKGEDGR